MITICTLLFFLMILCLVFLWPISSDVSELKSNVAEKEKKLLWMKDASAKIKIIEEALGKVDKDDKNRGKKNKGRNKKSKMEKIREAAVGSGFEAKEKADKRVRVTIKSVKFDDLSGWLGRLKDRHNISVVQANIKKQSNKKGYVEVKEIFLEAVE